MVNVYIDPYSYVYLDNAFFKENGEHDRDNALSFWRYLKNYCLEKNINLNTIDFWNKDKSTAEDVYVSFEHKNFLKRLYWRFKNKKYPRIELNKFKKRILFQFELPIVVPEVYASVNNLFKVYDKIFFACKLNPIRDYKDRKKKQSEQISNGVNNQKVHYFHYFQTYNSVLADYWNNSERGFLTMVNSNATLQNFRKFLMTILSTGKFPRLNYKELLSERIKAIEFFSRTNDIDLYGSKWNKLLPFPYWFLRKAIQRVYKGRAESKYATLSKYNFSICYESCIFPGYISEKIFDCFFAGNIPVYYGAPDIQEHIPKNCFIDRRDFKNYRELRIFLKSLTESEIKNYKENGRRFLESEKYRPFTKEYFAKIFVEACIN